MEPTKVRLKNLGTGRTVSFEKEHAARILGYDAKTSQSNYELADPKLEFHNGSIRTKPGTNNTKGKKVPGGNSASD